MEKLVRRDKVHCYFNSDIEPVLEVTPGQVVVLETEDAFYHFIKSEADYFTSSRDFLSKVGGSNPVTGPIYVKGAEPEDNLTVTIVDIKCNPEENYGWTTIVPNTGGLSSSFTLQPYLSPKTIICRFKEENILFPTKKGVITIPQRPMIGTIGVAPFRECAKTVWAGQDFVGNMDIPDVTIGNKVILPVNVDGGLLSLGDVHASLGQGEISGGAIDCRAVVRIKIDLIKKEESKYISWPQIEYPDAVGSMCVATSLTDATRAGYKDIIKRMAKFYSFDLMDAYQLCSAVGEVVVGGLWDPIYTCVVKISKKYIET